MGKLAHVRAPAPERTRIRRLLVAFDGSPGAWEALQRGIAIASAEHALLTVAAVVPQPSCWIAATPLALPCTSESLRRDMERHMLRQLAAARDEVPATVSVTTQLVHGRPRRVLRELAESGRYDLIVTAVRRSGFWRRRLRAPVLAISA
jgi:nucleotide-binding universal stress UspA family protein